MNKTFFFNSFLLTLFLLLGACSNNKTKTDPKKTNQTTQIIEPSEKGIFKIDALNSNIEWIGKKTTGQHNGNIKIKKGIIEIDENGNIIKGKFMLDMESINCTDLKGKRKNSIEEHLKNEDFFDTQKYPTALFSIDKVDGNTIFGTLKIKDISQQISFDYITKDKLTYTAEIIIDRTLFNIKYKSKTIFPDIGDHFIYDDFKISLNPISFK